MDPKSEFIPFKYEKCFFCLKGFTNCIAHKKSDTATTTFMKHDSTRTVKKGLTDARVNLEQGSQHCRQCYRNVDSSIGCKLT